MPKHHKVFAFFQPFNGECPAGQVIHGFLGTKSRPEFFARSAPEPRDTNRHVNAPYPLFNEDYFEWIDVLQSVIDAKKSYTMIELGAGIGCWAVRAAYAVEQYNPNLPYRLIAVEAEPTHFEWMRAHFLDNGIDPDQHLLIHAAVSEKPGEASFYVENPGGSTDPGAWYGQALTKDYEVDLPSPDAIYGNFSVRRHQSGAKSITVPAVTLAGILDGLRLVDLIHVDIQGAEFGVIRSAIQELDQKVKRLHIGTHGRDIEAGLRELLKSHHWRCLADYPSFSQEPTPWGPIDFQDGVQSWINPRFGGPWGRLSAWLTRKK